MMDLALFNVKLPIWFSFDPLKVRLRAINLCRDLWTDRGVRLRASVWPYWNRGGVGIGRMVVALTRTSGF